MVEAVIPRASIIVRTYNRPRLLERCLRGLLGQSPESPPHEIVVVDDCSDPETSTVMAGFRGSATNLTCIRHEVNRGRSGALTTGIDAANGEILLFVDDDVMVGPEYVAAHVRAHEAASSPVAVMGNLLFPPGIVEGSNYAKYLQSRYLGGRSLESLEKLGPSNLHPRFLIGAAASIRKADLQRAGSLSGMANSYGFEDHILAHALHRLGIRIVFAPEARAEHHDSVALAWYRAKLQEAARDGIPMLRRRAPEFLEETAYAKLLPADWSEDGAGRLVVKTLLRAALNPLTILALEAWARATDRIGWLYQPTVYRALSAGWFLQGLRMQPDGGRLVVYGD